jgi:hypothetical protein
MDKKKLKDLIWICFLIEEKQDEQFSRQDFAELIADTIHKELTYQTLSNFKDDTDITKNTTNTSNM